MCGLNDLATAKTLKIVETAYRKTNRWLNGTVMRLDELTRVIGVTLMTGRARHKANWEKERDDRCRADNTLQYINPEDGTTSGAIHQLENRKRKRSSDIWHNVARLVIFRLHFKRY